MTEANVKIRRLNEEVWELTWSKHTLLLSNSVAKNMALFILKGERQDGDFKTVEDGVAAAALAVQKAYRQKMHIPEKVACWTEEATVRCPGAQEDGRFCRAFIDWAQMTTLNGIACFRNGIRCARLLLKEE